MNKLFESMKKFTNIPNVSDAEITWQDVSFIQCKQVRLNDKFRIYLKTGLTLKKLFQMGIQKTPYQKLFQLRFDLKNYIVDFVATNRQFD